MNHKLLIIRFSSIGDIVLTSPVIRCLHDQLPDVEIHYLTKERFASIPFNNPYIQKVWSFKKNLSEVLPALKKEKFTHVIDLHNNLRSHLVLLSLLRPYHSFNKLNIQKWLLVRFKINRLPNVHIVDRYLETVAHLGIKNDGKGLDFFIPGGSVVMLDNEWAPLANGYVGLVIGGKHNTKILPADMVAKVIGLLKMPVVLLGGKEDWERGQQICELSDKAVNLCGKYNLMQSASLVQQASAIITNDTGLMHIAAAMHKPIVSIWGNTIPEFGMYPYLPGGIPGMIAEVKGLDCRPCSKIGFSECPRSHFKCMLNQDVKAIADFVNILVTNPR
ncbi:MAG: glycosyltransferase family 9 protein [Lentimicrobiaceae bacterium]